MDPEMNIWGFFDDDGHPINPDLYPRPALCLTCKKNDQPEEEVLCQLNRLDQRHDDQFICHAYVPLSE